MKNLDKYFISNNSSLEDAITKMIKQGVKTLIVEKNRVLLGTLSDGDIRKLILKKIKLKNKIKNYVFKNPKCLKKGYRDSSAKKILAENGYDLIPVIDEKKLIVDVITWIDLFNSNQKVFKKSKIKDIPILIMAGGLGTRLQPFTNILPKPLLPFKSKSIIENVIDQFEDYLVKNIYISINFKADLIKAYFKQILKKNKTISFLEESKKLGTCAPIKKLKKKFENIIVTNCDSLVDLDFNDLCDFHLKSKSMMTIVSANKKMVIPYGICKTNTKGRLYSFDEKPSYDYLANIGLYIINKKALNIIPTNKKFDMDELIYLMLKKKNKISTFPISDNQWIDVGQAESLKQSNG
jgi:dTDP-glucose pyrophosphorylase/CBS domain-containing protein